MPGFSWQKEKSPVMPRARKYPEELLERATRLVLESGRPIAHVGRDLGVAPETLRKYVRQVEADEGRATRSRLELAVVEYVAWFNNERIHENLGPTPRDRGPLRAKSRPATPFR
jgi:transposase-like protein